MIYIAQAINKLKSFIKKVVVVEVMLLIASCYGDQDKLQLDRPLGSGTDLTVHMNFGKDMVIENFTPCSNFTDCR